MCVVEGGPANGWLCGRFSIASDEAAGVLFHILIYIVFRFERKIIKIKKKK
jgi:hypothetical protein